MNTVHFICQCLVGLAVVARCLTTLNAMLNGRPALAPDKSPVLCVVIILALTAVSASVLYLAGAFS